MLRGDVITSYTVDMCLLVRWRLCCDRVTLCPSNTFCCKVCCVSVIWSYHFLLFGICPDYLFVSLFMSSFLYPYIFHISCKHLVDWVKTNLVDNFCLLIGAVCLLLFGLKFAILFCFVFFFLSFLHCFFSFLIYFFYGLKIFVSFFVFTIFEVIYHFLSCNSSLETIIVIILKNSIIKAVISASWTT